LNPPKEIINVGQLELRFLLDGNDTNGQIVMFEFLIPPGAKVPAPHYHAEVDEITYGLEGITSTYLNGERIDIAPGDRLFIPRGAVHQHNNHTDKTVKVLCMLSPASIGPDYFREIGDYLKNNVPPDMKMVTEIMDRHGLIVVV